MPSFLYSEEEAGIANLESIQEALFAPVSIWEDRSKSGLNISIFLFHQSRLFYFYFTYICIYWMGRVTTVYIEVRGQFESWLSPFNLGIPGLKVRSSGLVATVFALWTIFLVLNQDSWLQVEGKKGGGDKKKERKGKKETALPLNTARSKGSSVVAKVGHVLLALCSLCHFLQRAMGRKAVMRRSGTSRRSICFSAKTLQQQSFTQLEVTNSRKLEFAVAIMSSMHPSLREHWWGLHKGIPRGWGRGGDQAETADSRHSVIPEPPTFCWAYHR